jgi:LPS-assembly protein
VVRGLCVLGLLLLLSVIGAAAGRAQEPPSKKSPVLLQADELTYDQDLGVATAIGHVEISQGDRVLKADRVTYNERLNKVTASGNVNLVEPTGEVVSASYMELTDDLKEGTIENVGLLMADRSRMAAASGSRTGGNISELNKAVYSPCALCPDDPTRAPLWQLKAVKVIHDQAEKTIYYHDAWLEMGGVPVLYTPYWEMPDPTVKRKTGFLTPTVGYSRNLGFTARAPFYWAISPDKELTLDPLITTKQSIVAYGIYRERFDNGTLKLSGSGTVAQIDTGAGNDQGEFRGHIDSSGRFDLDNNWRWGFDALRETDKTYLRLYEINDQLTSARTLTSQLFAEGFYGRDYAMLQGYSFQGTRNSDDNGESPFVVPWMRYSYVGEPWLYGSYFTFDADALMLTREEGRDGRRLVVGGGWTLPYTSPLGDVYTVSATVHGDLYWVHGVDPNSNDVDPTGPTESGFTGRVFPQLAVKWNYPFVRDHGSLRETIEPIIAASVSPGDDNPDEIPNEDSLDVGFDETNLFDANRSTGYDQVDGGQRISYGFKWGLYDDGGGYGSILLGQSLQFDGVDDFNQAAGVEDNLSDVVGAIEISPGEYLDLLYRFQFDTADPSLQRSEVKISTGTNRIRLSLGHSFLDGEADPNNTFGDRQEVIASATLRFDDYWSTFAAGRYDIESGRPLYLSTGIRYQDECFIFAPRVTFSNFRDEEVEPDIKFLLTIAFKNLGSYDVTY